MLPTIPAGWMVAPAPEEGSGEGEATPLLSEESDSGELFEAMQDDTTISQGAVEIAVRVAQASEAFTGQSFRGNKVNAFTGQCFRCNKVRHWFHNEECEMYNPEFLNTSQGPEKISKDRQAPRVKGLSKTMGTKATHKAAPLKLSERTKIEVDGKEEVQAHKAHAFPFPKDHPNLSPTDLPTRRKHDAVPPRLLNADPLAQIISTETVADIIIDDTEACALLD